MVSKQLSEFPSVPRIGAPGKCAFFAYICGVQAHEAHFIARFDGSEDLREYQICERVVAYFLFDGKSKEMPIQMRPDPPTKIVYLKELPQ